MKKIFIISALILLTLPMITLADLGPKPSISLKFLGKTSNISAVKLFECTDQACTNKKEMESFGPQTISCQYGSKLSCYSMSYGYTNYLQVGAMVSKKMLYSNTFSTGRTMDSYFNVTVSKNSLLIEKTANFHYDEESLDNGEQQGVTVGSIFDSKLSIFALSLIITIIIELLIVIIYLLIKKTKSYSDSTSNNSLNIIILWIFLINLITIPLLWLTSSYINVNYYIFTTIAEITIVIVESIFIFITMKKTIAYKELLLLSIVMNIASFLLGNYILKIIG